MGCRLSKAQRSPPTMKQLTRYLVLLLALFLAGGCKQHADSRSALRTAGVRTFSSFDPPTPAEKLLPAHAIKFEQADLVQVLNLYADISGRSIIRGPNLPDVKITFSNQTPMTSVEALQALDTVLAAQGIAMVILGTQYAKAVTAKEAFLEPGPVVELRPDQLPDSSSYLIYIVTLNKVKATDVSPVLAPFSKLPSSIIAMNGGMDNRPSTQSSFANLPMILGPKKHSILILRDYSSNVRRMLQVLDKLEQQ